MKEQQFTIHIGKADAVRKSYCPGARRYPYTLSLNGKVVKTGSAWGADGAWQAAVKARDRLIVKNKC